MTLGQQETTEIKSRIRAAWASFSKYRQELTSRSYLLRHRLRLFNMVITPTLTYGSGTWTLSHEHERMIRSTRRKMLRLLIQTKRRYKRKIKNKEVRTEKRRTMKEANRIRQQTLTKEKARVQDAIKTATYPSRVTQMMTWTRVKSKKKIGSNTSKEAQETQKSR